MSMLRSIVILIIMVVEGWGMVVDSIDNTNKVDEEEVHRQW